MIAGPFENAGEYAGVFIFKVATLDEARALAESDPAVKAGRLKADVHPWLDRARVAALKSRFRVQGSGFLVSSFWFLFIINPRTLDAEL